ncbi:MAG: acyltransferase family protein [Gammaproteobacteria bacterium]|nr:acyltransferase family protein [Gammaproteobacteria bacterium]
MSAPQRQPVSRDLRADFLKAAAIVGVVLIHSSVPLSDVYRFCVPAFIGLWAFYAEKSMARREVPEQRAYLWHRGIELAVPYLAWTIFYIWMFESSHWRTASLHTIVGGWFGGFGWAGQYYFVILLQLVVLFPLLRRIATERTTMPLIFGGCLLNVAAGYWLFDNRVVAAIGNRPFVYWLPFAFAGIALARGQFKGNPVLLAAAAVALLCLAPFESRSVAETSYFSVSVTVASLCLLAAAVLADRRDGTATRTAREPDPFTNVVRVLGRNTFAIFVANVLMIEMISRAGVSTYLGAHVGRGAPFAVAALAILGCLFMSRGLRAVRLGVLVGRS